MKNSIKILSIIAIFLSSNLMAQDSVQVQNRKGNQYKQQNKSMNQNNMQKAGFVDEDGDGFNDNAPDVDGDGIPNGRDADYTGAKNRRGNNAKGFVDLDGDGINDNAIDSDGDGIPNGQDPDYVRPMDGSGAAYGQGAGNGQGTGDCDGTGTKGKKGKGKK